MSAEQIAVEDVAAWIADLAAAYNRHLSESERTRMRDVWWDELRHSPRHHVLRAVRELRAQPEGRMPTLGQLSHRAEQHRLGAERAQRGLDLDSGCCPQCGARWYLAGFLMPNGTVMQRSRCACAHYEQPRRPGEPLYRSHQPQNEPRAGIVEPEEGCNRWTDPRARGYTAPATARRPLQLPAPEPSIAEAEDDEPPVEEPLAEWFALEELP